MNQQQSGLDPFLADLAASGDEDAIEALTPALAPAPRGAPSPALRTRLLDAALPSGRLWRFERAVAELLDLSVERVRVVLDRLDEPSTWVPLMPGVAICWVDGGPRVQGALRGFMRVAAGVRTTGHEHVGAETVLVLQGAVREVDSGRIARPGELLKSEPGSSHSLEAVVGGPDLLQLSVSHGGMRVGGHLFKPPM